MCTIFTFFKFVIFYNFQEQTSWDKALIVAASVLAKLNKLNSNLHGHQMKKGQLKVPYTLFYIPQLAEKINLRFDYLNWAHSDLSGPKVRIYCCY